MTRRHYDWDRVIATARSQRGHWMLAFPNHPSRLAKRIRLRQHPKLRREDGRLEATILNEYRDGAVRRADVWVRWVPNTPDSPTEE